MRRHRFQRGRILVDPSSTVKRNRKFSVTNGELSANARAVSSCQRR